MNTASQQSIGGATAGAVGQGNLTAARTRNRGGFTGALDEAVRGGQRQLSENALGIQGENANLKEQQRQTALGSLQQLYGSNVQAQLAAMGLTPGTIGQWTNAAQATTNGVLGGINTFANLVKPKPAGTP